MKVRTAPITEIMARVIQAGRLDPETWTNELKPLLDEQPRQAGFEIRRLLILAASDRFEMPQEVAHAVDRTLREFGYSSRLAPDWQGNKPAGSPSQRVWAQISENVTEASPTFDKLRALVAPDAKDVTIAVLDTRTERSHPALAGAIARATDRVDGRLDELQPVREGGRPLHGTHVSGIAQRGTEHINVLPEAILADNGNLILPGETIDEVIKAGARVVNLSIATTEPGEADVIEAAILRHPETLFVIGAGNREGRLGDERYDPKISLAAREYPNMQVVTSSTREKTLARGVAVGADLAALGEQVLSAAPREKEGSFQYPLYFSATGTSMATPQVSSIAARCLVLDATLDPVAVGRLLDVTSDKSENWDDIVKANGTVNGERACAVAAAGVLVKQGETPDAAVRRLPIPSKQKPAVLAALNEFLRQPQGS